MTAPTPPKPYRNYLPPTKTANPEAFAPWDCWPITLKWRREYETAVEQFLHDELEYVVVETFDLARAGVSLLRGEMGGRATFFVDSLRTLNWMAWIPIRSRSRKAPLTAWIGSWNFAIRWARLQSIFFPSSGRHSWWKRRRPPNAWRGKILHHHFVTTDGTCYHGRMVSGGRPGDAGPLGLKRELRMRQGEVLS